MPRPPRCASPSSTVTTSTRPRSPRCGDGGSVIGSWLLDLTAAALLADPDLEGFRGRVSDSGEGRWTLLAAVDEGVPAHVLSAALFDRFESRGEAEFANRAPRRCARSSAGTTRRRRGEDRRHARVGGPRRPRRRDAGGAPARAVRRRSPPGGAAVGRGRRPLPRLLEAPRDRRDDRAPAGARGACGPARAHRRDVRRRADQRHRGSRGTARRPPCPARGQDRGRRPRRACPRCTRCSIAWARSPSACDPATGRASRANGSAPW